MARAEKIFDQEYTATSFDSAGSPVTISSLEGDLYDYEISLFCTTSSATDTKWQAILNADTATNYDYSFQDITSTSASTGTHSTGQTEFEFRVAENANYPEWLMIRVFGDSSASRHVRCRQNGAYASAWSVGANWHGTWNNSVDELTSIKLQTDVAKTMDYCWNIV